MQRREFLRHASLAAAGVAVAPTLRAATTPETRVAQLYSSMTEAQKGQFHFPFDDPLAFPGQQQLAHHRRPRRPLP